MARSAAKEGKPSAGAGAKRPWRPRLRRWWRYYQWPVILVLGAAAAVLGYAGFAYYYAAHPEVAPQPRSLLDLLYLTLQLFVVRSGALPYAKPWELEVARLLTPALFFYTAVVALAVIFQDQVRWLRLHWMSDHTVICGLGRRGWLLAKGCLNGGDRVVVIDRDPNDAHIQPCRDEGATVLIGRATEVEWLRQARVQDAKRLIAVCGDDGDNAEIAVHARELCAARTGKALHCHVHVVDPDLCALLAGPGLGMPPAGPFRLDFFNTFDAGARALLKQFPPFGESRDPQTPPPHIVVVGIGRLGQGVVAQAAREWWVSQRKRQTRERMRVTIVDREAERRAETLRLRYPKLEQACEIIPVQMDVEWPEFQQAAFLFDSAGRCAATHVYICLDGDALGLKAALALHQRVRECDIPIVVRMTEHAGLAALLRRDIGVEACQGEFANLHAFGLLNCACDPELVLRGINEVLARAIHEVYVEHMRSLGHTPATKPAMVPWDDLKGDKEHYRESNRQAADDLPRQLLAAGYGIAPLTDWDADLFKFADAEVELMAEMEHDRWVKERLAAGWRLGPRDDNNKIHPDLIRWDELAEEVKEYDRVEVRKRPMILARAGFQLCRLKRGEA